MARISWDLLHRDVRALCHDLSGRDYKGIIAITRGGLIPAGLIARELGIPAVVGCGDATDRLKTGDRVHVDGARGIVEILTNR